MISALPVLDPPRSPCARSPRLCFLGDRGEGRAMPFGLRQLDKGRSAAKLPRHPQVAITNTRC